MNKSINTDFTPRIDNFGHICDSIPTSWLYTPNMVGIMGMGGNRTFLVLLPKIGEFGQELSDYLGQLRNKYTVQTQIILSCKLFFYL